jgi:hypothetical protein
VDGWIKAVSRQGQPPQWQAWSITTLFVVMAFLIRLTQEPVHPYLFLLFPRPSCSPRPCSTAPPSFWP